MSGFHPGDPGSNPGVGSFAKRALKLQVVFLSSLQEGLRKTSLPATVPKQKPEAAPPAVTMPAYSNVIIPPPAMATDNKKVQQEAEDDAKGNDEEDLDKLSLLERVRKY